MTVTSLWLLLLSTHGAHTPVLWMSELEQAAVHWLAKGASHEKENRIPTHSLQAAFELGSIRRKHPHVSFCGRCIYLFLIFLSE